MASDQKAFDLSRVLPLLESSVEEENLAGLLVGNLSAYRSVPRGVCSSPLSFPGQLLAKHPDGPRHQRAHASVRPYLLRLLRVRPAYRELAVSVLAASLEALPLETALARELVEPLARYYLDESDETHISDDLLEAQLTCLVGVVGQADETLVGQVFERTARLIVAQKTSDDAMNRLVSLASICLSLFPAQCKSDAELLQTVVRIFCTHQTELKFSALALILHLLGQPNMRSRRVLKGPVLLNLRSGLLNLLHTRSSEPIFGVLRCVTLVTSVTESLQWACEGEKDGFFPLLMGLVGVEVSMAFDKEQVDSQLLMACLEILELVMRNLRDDEVMPSAELLKLREKLNDINRVALEYLIVFAESATSPDDLRPRVATRIVATWTFLDPDAVKTKEVVALVPQIVERLPWFLPVLSEHWAMEDAVRAAFVQQAGLAKLGALLEEHLVPVARLVLEGKADTMQQWNGIYWVNPFDSIISACSVLVTCCMFEKRQPLPRTSELVQCMVQASKTLLGRRDSEDCSLLMGFIAASLAQVSRFSTVAVDSGTAQTAARVLAMYLPVALESGGLTTVRAVASAIESKCDGLGVGPAVRELGVDEMLSSSRAHWDPEQKEVAQLLLSSLSL